MNWPPLRDSKADVLSVSPSSDSLNDHHLELHNAQYHKNIFLIMKESLRSSRDTLENQELTQFVNNSPEKYNLGRRT